MSYTKANDLQATRDNIEQISVELSQAETDGAYMAAVGLCETLCELKYKYLVRFIGSMSSGTVASIIGNNKYIQIDRAINKTIVYLSRLYNDSEPELVEIGINPESIATLINKCYHDNTL